MNMSIQKLQSLIRQPEGLKLDFKQELYQIYHKDKDIKSWGWDEFIKDILSLANRNVGCGEEYSYLIIGVGDTLHEDSTRDMFDVDAGNLTPETLLKKVNSACHPSLPDIDCGIVRYKNKRIFVVTIPFSPHVHYLSRELNPKKNKIYHKSTVFIRHNESIAIASPDEIDHIRAEKERLEQNSKPKNIQLENIRKQRDKLRNKKTRCKKLSENEEAELEQTKKAISYLEGREKYRSEIETLSGKERGITSYQRAESVLSTLEEFALGKFIDPDQLREEAQECLEDALNCGFRNATVYCKLARLYFYRGTDIFRSFDYCREAIKKKKDYKEAYEVGIQICESLTGYDNAYRGKAAKRLTEYKKKLQELEREEL
jgi:hypothetical protein